MSITTRHLSPCQKNKGNKLTILFGGSAYTYRDKMIFLIDSREVLNSNKFKFVYARHLNGKRSKKLNSVVTVEAHTELVFN